MYISSVVDDDLFRQINNYILLRVIYQIMFGNSYQNGHYFQVWDSRASNDKNELYKQLVKMVPPSNKNYFDKQVKSYVYSLQGQTAKMILPASEQKELALHQKFLVLHIFIPVGSQWSMQISITDINGIKRRVNLTTVQGKMEIKFFSIRYPVDNMIKGTWLFLAINVHSFIDAFKSQVFRSLDHLTIGSNCTIRRIFTMKQWLQWEIPKSFWLNNQINQQFQLIQYRQLSLPKISLNKSVNYDQSPNQIDNKSSAIIKHSKSNLNKSQLTPKQALRNMITKSQTPSKRSQLLPKQNSSIIAYNKSNIISQSAAKNMRRKSQNQKKGEIQLNKMIQNKLSKINSQKVQQNQVKISPKKSPMIQKSFQQDQALNYKPNFDQQNNFETSHESFINRPFNSKNGNKKTQRWQDDSEAIKISSKAQNTQNTQKKKQKINGKQNVKILTKQNSIKKISNGQTKQELQLIYDEMVGCYYHPETQTYYQIKQ